MRVAWEKAVEPEGSIPSSVLVMSTATRVGWSGILACQASLRPDRLPSVALWAEVVDVDTGRRVRPYIGPQSRPS